MTAFRHTFMYEGTPDVPPDMTLKAWRRGHLPQPRRAWWRRLLLAPLGGWRS